MILVYSFLFLICFQGYNSCDVNGGKSACRSVCTKSDQEVMPGVCEQNGSKCCRRICAGPETLCVEMVTSGFNEIKATRPCPYRYICVTGPPKPSNWPTGYIWGVSFPPNYEFPSNYDQSVEWPETWPTADEPVPDNGEEYQQYSTVAPPSDTTVAPSPDKTVAPSPDTTVAPSPDSTAAPPLETTAAPFAHTTTTLNVEEPTAEPIVPATPAPTNGGPVHQTEAPVEGNVISKAKKHTKKKTKKNKKSKKLSKKKAKKSKKQYAK